MATIAVLGGGAIGSFIAWTLDRAGHQVRLLDSSKEVLEANRQRCPEIEALAFDATNPAAYSSALTDCDLAVPALPGRLGHGALRAIIEAGVDCVDISFGPEDPGTLSLLAGRRKVTVVFDAGVAPGLSNLLAARLVEELGAKKIERLDIFVGGLPLRRDPPWEYAAPFSISDVIEEYTRPARVKQDGQVVEIPALSGRRPLEVAGVGVLEAFLTDGLRSLLKLPVADMAEYTLRYPGHATKVELLREAGFFSTTPIKIKETTIAPRELTLALLRDQWKLRPGEAEFTHLRVEARTKEGEVHGWVVHDNGPDRHGWTSMARTTGLTAAAFAELLLSGAISKPGVHPSERFGNESDIFALVVNLHREAGVIIQPF